MNLIRAICVAGVAFAVFWLVFAFALGVMVGSWAKRPDVAPAEPKPEETPETTVAITESDPAVVFKPDSSSFEGAIFVPKGQYVIVENDWHRRQN